MAESRSTARQRVGLERETESVDRLVEAIAQVAEARAVLAWGPDGTYVASPGWTVDAGALEVARETLDGDVAESLAAGDAALGGLDRGCPAGCEQFFLVAPESEPVRMLLGVGAGRQHDARIAGAAALGRAALRCALGGSLETARLETTREIVSGIGHDVGTPLNVISGYSEYLLMGLGEEAKGRKELSSILEQTRRVAQMIQQMLDIVRVPTDESGRTRPLSLFCDESLHLAAYMLRKAQVRSRVEGTVSEQAKISGDVALLHQALFNVLADAAKRAGVGAQLVLRPVDGTEGTGIELEGRDASGAPVDLSEVAGSGRGVGSAFVESVLGAYGGGLVALDGEEDAPPRLFVRFGG